MKEINQEILKDAQYRKGLSIAFFNATNATIELAKVMAPSDMKAFIKEWRNFFLDEHKEYYATVINSVGANYDIKTTLEKLNKATNLDNLKQIYKNLSADEKKSKEVKELIIKLKEKYENIQIS